MRKLILASHSNFAKGLKDTVQFLTSIKNEQIFALCAYVDGNDDIDQMIEKLLNLESDEYIILTDMAGGSVNQKFYQYMSDKVQIISGINLPLALSIALQINNENLNLKQLVKESQQQIIYLNLEKNVNAIGDE
ncbi:PTS fructose transporter subunit IIA [Bombilactobacillus bombi]|uniref:PTS fructose transporter subunit IIA n=1 Tax=Bombilactobacillus bombi TaxID=1303590 RepID=A0A347SSR3_9LACO|nr:PTS fructose transporter subunit IIA [Bombilactobacillus bombi]AXX65072.1 PTS fructose transporter subunit IIA [Bombilactobacillus bombi]RHW45651.1 PTS fructose transporter subunit IIA [Bombilactobacillus bombi]